MKTKLLFNANPYCKNGIFTSLIIFFMTFNSFGQQGGIEFTCSPFIPTGNDVIIAFGEPDTGGPVDGHYVWSNGTDGLGGTGYTLKFEADNTWSVRDSGNVRFFYSSVNNGELPSCTTSDWMKDDMAYGQYCEEIYVNCIGGSPEVCDGVDNNGDGVIDEGYDLDGDGYTSCSGDCDDNDASIYPGAIEVVYDGVDNDCDPSTLDDDLDQDGFAMADDCDDNDASVNETNTFYVDADGDGYGTTAEDLCASTVPAGYATIDGDCDDTDPTVNPGAEEIPYDTIDNDCDPTTLDDESPETVYEYCNPKKTKVMICHNGKNKCVSINAVDAHLAHGDTLGSCDVGRLADTETVAQDILEENTANLDVVSWPNPSNEFFNVRMITPNTNDKVSIQAFDINGRLILSNTISGNEDHQFGSQLTSGIYFVKLTQNEYSEVIKLVKQ